MSNSCTMYLSGAVYAPSGLETGKRFGALDPQAPRTDPQAKHGRAQLALSLLDPCGVLTCCRTP